MNQKSFYVIFSAALLILFVLIYQGSYAYFTASITDEREDISSSLTTADLQDITLVNGGDKGLSPWIPGDSHEFPFTINNPGSVDLCVKLLWKDVTNEWTNKNDLVYTVTDSAGNEIIKGKQFPSTPTGEETQEIGTVKITAKTNNQFKVKVTYKNTDQDQSNDMDKTFSAKITGQLTECPSEVGGGA